MGLSSTRFLRLSHQFSRYYTGQFSSFSAQTGLSMSETGVLLFFFNNPELDTARDVTELHGLGKSQVSQAVEQLAGRNLLLRRPDESDRRVVHLTLTQTGIPLAQQAREVQRECGRDLITGLSPEELGQLEKLVEKIAANVDAMTRKEH